MKLPLAQAEEGSLFDRKDPHDLLDATFADWEAPLVWHHMPSYLLIDTFFNGKKSLHFAFEKRVPQAVWQKGWHLWYDNALVHRQHFSDGTLTAKLALEEVTAGYGGDNVDHIRPWTGIVARMRDCRAYYYCCLEYPNKVVLYRRDDKQWVVVGEQQVTIDVWVEYELKLEMNGNDFRVSLNDELLFSATDYAFESGWCGVRATCTSFVTDFEIQTNSADTLREGKASNQQTSLDPARKTSIPQPMITHEIDLNQLGELAQSARHNTSTQAGYFAHDRELQLLVSRQQHQDGATHVLIDLDGTEIWRADLRGIVKLLCTPPRNDGGCNLYGIAKNRMLLINGHTGAIINEQATPTNSEGKSPNPGNGPASTADLDGTGLCDHFFLTWGPNEREITAVGPDLSIRWQHTSIGGHGHGNHLSLCKLDDSGRDYIYSGNEMLSADGEVIWQQEEIEQRLLCPNGGHVDSTVMDHFAGPDHPPTITLACSSAGAITCDARNGNILAVHPQGHCQTASAGKVIPGSNEVHAIICNRWGSYGVTAIFDPRGKRVSRFQAGFTSQNAKPITWASETLQHLLICDGKGWRGIYDHLGNRLIDLDPFIPYTADPHLHRFDRVGAKPITLKNASRDSIMIQMGPRIVILAPE